MNKLQWIVGALFMMLIPSMTLAVDQVVISPVSVTKTNQSETVPEGLFTISVSDLAEEEGKHMVMVLCIIGAGSSQDLSHGSLVIYSGMNVLLSMQLNSFKLEDGTQELSFRLHTSAAKNSVLTLCFVDKKIGRGTEYSIYLASYCSRPN